MSLKIYRCCLAITFAAAVLGGPVKARADHKRDFGDFTKGFFAKAKDAHIKSVAIADFMMSDGSRSELGWYVADKIYDRWSERSPHFHVLDRDEMQYKTISKADLASTESFLRVSAPWHVDAVVVGTIEDMQDSYVLNVELRRVKDNGLIASDSLRLAHSPVFDLLSPKGWNPDKEPAVQWTPGQPKDSKGIPQCLYCPDPDYTDRARKDRAQGIAILLVVISAEGVASKVSVQRPLRDGLTEKAIEAVTKWKFKPATNSKGEPISVQVPVEFSFRLY